MEPVLVGCKERSELHHGGSRPAVPLRPWCNALPLITPYGISSGIMTWHWYRFLQSCVSPSARHIPWFSQAWDCYEAIPLSFYTSAGAAYSAQTSIRHYAATQDERLFVCKVKLTESAALSHISALHADSAFITVRTARASQVFGLLAFPCYGHAIVKMGRSSA